jgi:Transposase DDE domain/Insertion element 4 transposase N-terminal
LAVVATTAVVGAALTAAGYVEKRRRVLTGAVTTVLVLGLCLFAGEGSASVLGRLWPLLRSFNPAVVLGGPVSAVALSQARARLPPGVLRAVFEAAAGAGWAGQTPGLRVFGLVVTAVDGTVFDLAGTPAVGERFAVPSGGRFPQARVVTLVVCGTRRVLAAVLDSCGVSEQRLWDRLVGQLQPGTLNLADRNFFSMDRWRTAAATGAQLAWRVKNGTSSLPATVIETLPDRSQLVRLRESDAMLTHRRKTSGHPNAPRLEDITARLVEFTVTVTDQAGQNSTSRFRVLTTLLAHDAYPATAIAECYAQRWQVELVYKTIKSTLRGTGRRLRGQAPDLAEQEIWGLLTVYNALVDQAVAAAVDLGHRPRRDLLHRRPPRHPRPPQHPHPLPGMRPPSRPRRPDRRDHRRSPKPHRPTTDRPQNEKRTTSPAHPQRHLHHRHHPIKSTHSGLIGLLFRAVGMGQVAVDEDRFVGMLAPLCQDEVRHPV